MMRSVLSYSLVSVLLMVVLLPVASAQVLDGHFTTVFSEGTSLDGGDQYAVTLALRSVPAAPLGSATLRVRYNSAALQLRSGTSAGDPLHADDYTLHDYHQTFLSGTDTIHIADYSLTSVTHPDPAEVSINVVLSTTGSGRVLPDRFTPVATLWFTVLDPHQDAELSWRSEGPNSTEAFHADNQTLFTLGTFTGEAVIIQNEPAIEALPRVFQLNQNYPNPFNPVTTITYALPHTTPVHLVIYDVLGREVITLVDTSQAAGTHAVQFDAQHVTSGLYFYRMTAGPHRAVRSMLVLK